jgi:hypothetical protein
MPKRAALFIPLVALVATPALAHGAPRGNAKVSVGGKTIAIDYGRPSLMGRDMLTKAPVGTTWRMGADDPTTLKTEVDLKSGAIVVPKGDYVLTATRTAEDQWTLNVEKRDPAKPREPGTTVAAIPLASSPLSDSVEALTIDLTSPKGKGAIQFEMRWGTNALKASFSTP